MIMRTRFCRCAGWFSKKTERRKDEKLPYHESREGVVYAVRVAQEQSWKALAPL